MFSILIAHSDHGLCSKYVQYFQEQGIEAHMVHNGREALEQTLSGKYSIIVAELLMPEMRGMDLLSAIRRQLDIPVFLISEKPDEIDRILALEMGADDCLLAPISARELLARTKAMLRRTMPWESDLPLSRNSIQSVQVGDICVNPASYSATCSGTALDLTAVEFRILEILLRTSGHPVSREHLCLEALGREFTAYDRSIDVHVSNLRRKLGKHSNGSPRIHTIRGTGYLYALQANDAEPEPALSHTSARDRSTTPYSDSYAPLLSA